MAWHELFTSDIGLLSLFTILFMVVMAVYIVGYAMKKAGEENRAQARAPGDHSHAA